MLGLGKEQLDVPPRRQHKPLPRPFFLHFHFHFWWAETEREVCEYEVT